MEFKELFQTILTSDDEAKRLGYRDLNHFYEVTKSIETTLNLAKETDDIVRFGVLFSIAATCIVIAGNILLQNKTNADELAKLRSDFMIMVLDAAAKAVNGTVMYAKANQVNELDAEILPKDEKKDDTLH